MMEIVSDRKFSNEVVELDNRHFVDCDVANCLLTYNGGQVVLERTHFKGCSFEFGNGAAKVVALLECFGIVDAKPSETTTKLEVIN